jgi:hypothetical protein
VGQGTEEYADRVTQRCRSWSPRYRFFAVYYNGKEFASSHSSVITGAPLNILLNSAVAPSTRTVEKTIGGKPKNSDSSPAAVEIKYLNVWAYNPPS